MGFVPPSVQTEHIRKKLNSAKTNQDHELPDKNRH